MSINIWQLEILDNETYEHIHSIYFFTRRSACHYGMKKEKEWEENGWTWTLGGEPLYFGRIKE